MNYQVALLMKKTIDLENNRVCFKLFPLLEVKIAILLHDKQHNNISKDFYK